MGSRNTPRKPHSSLIICLKINGIFLGADLLLGISLLLLQGGSVGDPALFGLLATLLFFEAGLMFLIGGAVEMTSNVFFTKVREYLFHSKEDWSISEYEKGRRKAFLYVLVGALLFAESIMLSLIT